MTNNVKKTDFITVTQSMSSIVDEAEIASLILRNNISLMGISVKNGFFSTKTIFRVYGSESDLLSLKADLIKGKVKFT